MCGVAGWLCWEGGADAALVGEMTRRLHHRGPDASGVVRAGPLVLGHTRLSVIDLDPRSHQPLWDRTGELLLAYNGEVYNFRELRAELEARGARFATEGDSEVVLEAYRAWGPACVTRFNGMFAFALWDGPRQRLMLARDRLGKKPLFVHPTPTGFLFASEIGALRAHAPVAAQVDPAGLVQFLALNYTVGETTLARGTTRLLPAHYLLAERDRPARSVRYWDLARFYRAKRAFRSAGEAAEEMAALLDDAVRARLVSDVPLGAFLSGGIDSSAIAASMVRALPPGRVRTFSMGFDRDAFSELDEARAAATHLGVDHHERSLAPDLDAVIAAVDSSAAEPLADSSVLPMYHLARFAREQVTVALSGDGGDECFAGYPTYVADRIHHWLGWLPAGAGRGLGRLVERLVPVHMGKVSFDYKLRRFLAGLALAPPRAHASWRGIFDAPEREALLRPEVLARDDPRARDPFTAFEDHFRAVADCHYIDQALYVDTMTWLPDDILVKVDRATMAHALEARAPFLDHRVVEFAAALPVGLKLRGFTKKFLLKKSQAERLPRHILHRRKEGFNAPVSHWLAGPLHEYARDAMGGGALADWLRPGAVDRLWSEHRSGRRDNGLRLFGLLSLALWLRPDGDRAAPAPARDRP